MPILTADSPGRSSVHEGQRYWPDGLGHLLNAAYQAMYPHLQDFDTLARRGGIGWAEGVGLLFDWYRAAEDGRLRPDVQRPPIVLSPDERAAVER